MAGANFQQSNRRYRRVFWPVIVIYCVLCFAGPLVLVGEPPRWMFAAAALITATPIAVIFWLMLRYTAETDEFTRLVQLRAIAHGAMITIAIAVGWGFLQLFQVAPPPWAFWAGPLFFAAYGLSYWRLQAAAAD